MKQYMMRKAGGLVIVGNKFRKREAAGNVNHGGHADGWKMRYIAKAAVVFFIIAGAAGVTENMSAIAAAVSGAPVSRGVIQCEDARIDASDFQNIYSYMADKKNAAVGILLQLGTKFRQQSGEIICDRDPDAGQGDVEASQLSWPMITQAVTDSQSVPGGLAVLNPEAAMHIEGVGEYTDWYVTATEDNISRGKAAWADGRLLLGNGADNDRAYQAGFRDGGNGYVPEILFPLFSTQGTTTEIKHVHVGSPADVEGVSGCYKNYTSTHTRTEECGATLKETESTWYPNPEEPGGGSWHGGEYTCPSHGGLYSSPGTCPYEEVISVTVWQHDIVCGLTGAVYARLTIKEADTDCTDEAIRLEAFLEQGAGYRNLAWRDANELIWTDENGNLLGTGSELTVQAPGIYQCSINVSNTDIDQRTARAVVRVSGLMLRN